MSKPKVAAVACCLLIALVFAPPLGAGDLDWTAVGPPGGEVRPVWGDFRSFDPWLVSAGDDLWRTTDQGETWEPATRGLPRAAAFRVTRSRSAPQFLLAGLYRSSDGGQSWRQITSLPLDPEVWNSVGSPVLHPSDPRLIYVPANAGQNILASSDGGETWRLIAIPAQYLQGKKIGELWIDPGQPHPLYAELYESVNSSFIKSEDGGETWTQVEGNIPLVWVDQATGETVRVDPTTLVLPGEDGYLFNSMVQADQFHLRRLYRLAEVESKLRLYRSDDAGQTWTWKPLDQVEGGINGLIIAGANSLLLATAARGVLRSTDEGETWSPVKSGPVARSYVESIHGFSQLPKLRYLVSLQAGYRIYRSDDAGASWEDLGPDAPYPTAVDPANPLVQLGIQAGYAVRSTDGGQTWQVLEDIPPLAYPPLQYAFSKAGRVYALARGLFVSRDSGATWTEASTLPDKPGIRMAVSSHDPDVVFVVTLSGHYPVVYSGFHRSTDGGVTWKTLDNSFPDLIAFDSNNPEKVLRAYDRIALEKSTDLGDTWTTTSLAIPGLNLSSLVVDPSDCNRILASGDAEVYESINGGLSWRQIGPKTPIGAFESVDLKGIFLEDRAHFYLQSGGALHELELPLATDRYFPHIASGQSGLDRVHTLLTFANTGADTELELHFRDDKGSPMPVTLEGLGRAADFRVPMAAGASWKAETAADGPVRTGYLRWSAGPRVTGAAIYRTWLGGDIQYQVGVPEARRLTRGSLLVRNDEKHRVAVAVLNPSGWPARVELNLYDQAYNLLRTQTKYLQPRQRFSQYASEMFSENLPEEGVIVLRSSEPVMALSLLQYTESSAQSGSLETRISALPLIPDDPDVRGDVEFYPYRRVYLPQFADGTSGQQRVVSEIQLFNTGQSTGAGPVTVYFRSSHGPLEVDLEGLGRGSTFNLMLPGGHVRTLRTTGSGALKTGYVMVDARTYIQGAITYRATSDGEVLYQVGMPPPEFAEKLSVPFWTSRSEDTAFALTGASEWSGNYETLGLYDSGGTLRATTSMADIDPDFTGDYSHTVKYVSEVFEEAARGEVTQGLVSIPSDSIIAAIGLNQLALPGAGGRLRLLLTSVPVAPGVPGFEW